MRTPSGTHLSIPAASVSSPVAVVNDDVAQRDTPASLRPSRMAWRTIASEQSVAPPTGLTLMPTTSPFSKNERHASVQLGAPVSAVIPLSIILRTGSD